MAGLRKIRWELVGVGIGLILFHLVTEAFFDSIFTDWQNFADRRFLPDTGELLANLLVFAMVLALIAHAWRKTDALDAVLAELAIEKTRSEAILAAIPDAVTVQNPDYRIIYQNPAMRRAMGDHIGEYCYTTYQGRTDVCPDCRLFTENRPTRREVYKEELPRYLEIISAPLHDPQGQISAGLETVRDITARKLDEVQLRRQLEAIEASIDGIALLDLNGKYLHLNLAHAQIYGYLNPDELIGRSWHILYTLEERQRLEPLIFNGIAQSGGWRGEGCGLKKDGSLFPQEISLTALEDGGMICVVRDISDRKQAEEKIRILNENLTRQTQELQIINRDLEAFSYSLAHDLRTPLTGVLLAAENFVEICDVDLDKTGKLLLKSILQSCDQMEDLIEAMLELFKVSRQEIVRKPVNLSTLTAEILVPLRLRHPDRNLELNITEGMSACCDPHLVRILLENLLGNAWKYTARQEVTRIEFGGESRGEKRCFFVRDNGAGFDMSNAGKLFQPFQRLHLPSDFPGTGIGLATVQRIIDRHAGRIWATGECGKGATFYFTLPLPEGSTAQDFPA